MNQAIILVGEGSSGKTMLIRHFTKFHNQDGISAFSLKEIIKNRFSISQLKKYNICEGIENFKLFNTDKWKSLVAGEDMETEKKYEDPVFRKIVCNFIFTALEIPKDFKPSKSHRIKIVYISK